ncbi:uncharacterized protein LOC110738176 [Chenopodium quinoa]|uniref:uncharacterized protein LOC110738176 n=1 Tax=Chenopodium quinoa TaxID=63459 RepID=UPI000B77AF48|nr:uncharacterized protein LOC110738176 [Chenopodium quinoa]
MGSCTYSSDKVGGSPNIVGQTDFQDWKFDSRLLDIPFSGPTFTWTNGHHNGNPTFERLDKAYATNDWLIKYPDTSILHQPILFSDHAAIILREHRVLEGRKPYRVDNWCLLSKEVASIVSFSRKLDILGAPMFSISRRLEDLRSKLLRWCVTHRKLWGINWKELHDSISPLAQNLESKLHRHLFLSLREEKVRHSQAAYLYWKQRAKVKWDVLGDSHSHLLFSYVQNRRRKNTIQGLQTSSGDWTHDQDQIRSIVFDYFSSIYRSNQPLQQIPEFDWSTLNLPYLSEVQKSNLMVPFSASEIKAAMFSIDDAKSPRPDGFTSAFFKSHWSVVGSSVIEAIQYFFLHGHLLKEWNRTFIVLIPKCVSTVSYQLLVNGNPIKVFRLSCGLRQGDPLSSYLFVLCMEIFSAMINQAESTGLFKGVKVSRYAPSISHLFFADDSLLFFQPSPQACSNVLGVVQQFYDISGQMLNLQKSFVRFSPNVPENYRESLANSLQLKSLPSLGTYLGLPMDMGRSKRTAYQPLVDKITSRLMSFASLHLSPAAKLVVINSVLIASLNHILSVFKIPSSISDRINNLFVRFWWKTGNHSKSLALTPPSVLFTPKGLGGLGIRHLGLFNSAFLARQSWRIRQNSQLLISRVFQAKYPSLMCFRSQGRLSNPSWGCRSVLHGIQTLKIGLAWKIDNGSKVHILQDSWVPGSPVYFKNSLAGSVQPTLVSSLLDPISNDWDPTLIHALFSSTIASKILSLERPPQLMDDYVYWKYSRDDRFSSKSAYAKLIALSNQLPEGSSSIPPIPWSKIWALPILSKWKLFIWKIFHNALPVADTLRTKGCPVDPVCSFCFQASETTEHLFLRCSFIRRLWHCGPLGIRLPCFNSSFHQWFSSLLLSVISIKNWDGLDSILSFAWAIWIHHNHIRFRQATCSLPMIFQIAQEWTTRSQAARSSSSFDYSIPPGFGSLNHSSFLAGNPNISPTVILIVDGAWDSSDCQAGTGWCFYSIDTSSSLGGAARACFSLSAFQTELQACFFGLKMALHRGYSHILLRTDCLLLVSILHRSSQDMTTIWIQQQLRDILSLFEVCFV